MPRGFRIDRQATADAFRDGRLTDKRSFISLPKEIGSHTGRHYILYGEDKKWMRARIFEYNRSKHWPGVNCCFQCGCIVSGCPPIRGYPRGEWHHIRSKPGERCDCLENGVVACAKCHRDQHVRTKFSAAP